jgi:putative oxidoreductase
MKLSSYSSLNTDLAALLLRLIFGGFFMYHGYSKFVAFNQIAPMFPDMIGIGSKITFILVILAELGGGLMIVLGYYTRLFVLPILAVMIGAFFVAHAKDPFQTKELAFSLLCLCLPVFLLGSGKYSADKIMKRR